MGLYASIALIGALTVLILVFAALYVAARRAAAVQDMIVGPGQSDAAGDTASRWSSLVGSLDEPVRPHPSAEIPAWKRHVEAANAGDPGIYKSRPTSPLQGERWNPYAESQSTASRVKAARRKPRPQRVQLPPDPIESWTSANDPYALLGVSRVASTEDIERAYRRRVSAVHPDKFHRDPIGRQHAHEALKQLNAAMKELRDRRSRTRDEGESDFDAR